jgi:hypothetical protein
MALAEVELVPFWNFVEDASTTVTFSPAAVDIVKLDVDTLSTVPDAPPEAGSDRALAPAFAVVAVLAAAEVLLEVARTMP